MKRMKKIVALGLAAVLTLGMSMTAWAAPSPGDDKKVGTKDDKGSITVNGIDEASDSTVEAVAYPIIQAHYDGNGIFDGYTKLYADLTDEGWGSIPVDSKTNLITGYNGDSFNPEVVNNVFAEASDRETVDALTERILDAAKNVEGVIDQNETLVEKNGISLTRGIEDEKITSFYSHDVPVGTYLVILKNSEIKNYTPVLVSSYYQNGTGMGNTLTDGSLDITAGEAWVKVTDKPAVGDKKVTQVNRPGENGTPGEKLTDDNGKEITNSANIGDVLTYQITVNSIPYYGGSHPKFKVTDTLTGMEYADNKVTVKIVGGGEGNTDVTLASTEYAITDKDGNVLSDIAGKTEMVLDFVVGGTYTLNAYQGKNMVIEYRATVTDKAKVNADPNTNQASLEYSKNSHYEGDEGKDPGKITNTYTFDISGTVGGNKNPLLEKVDQTTGKALGGAEFKLYTDEDCTKEYKNPTTKSPIVSDGDGKFAIKGLAEGTYWFKETKAPGGYSLNEHAFKIVIGAEYEEKPVTKTSTDSEGNEVKEQFVEKFLASWSVTIDEKEVNSFTVEHAADGTPNQTGNNPNADSYKINNTKLINLPSTGGIGTTIFTVVGVLLMVGAAFLFFVNRRKAQNRQEK